MAVLQSSFVLAHSTWNRSPFISVHNKSRLVRLVAEPSKKQRRVILAAADTKGQERTYAKGSLGNFLGMDYYQILGVSVNTPPREIRKAYWQLQKKYHPDVAGDQGHSMALLLNEAYNTLMDEHRRNKYEREWRSAEAIGVVGFTGQPRSSWNGPDWPQGIFVDESVCVGCQECAFEAPNTFVIDAETAKARVKVQWGDHESRITAATEACPVKCIHAVAREDLAILEFVMQPRKREGSGVWGGGWEAGHKGHVFQAALSFKRRLQRHKDEEDARRHTAKAASVQETPAQRAARVQADHKSRGNPLWWLWGFGATRGPAKSRGREGPKYAQTGDKVKFSWQKVFGKASTSQISNYRVPSEEVPRVVTFVQEWACLWACASEVPLPFPFKVDFLTGGVRLTLITTSSGSIEPIGSLLITLENPSAHGSQTISDSIIYSQTPRPLNDLDNVADVKGGDDAMWTLSIKREGITNDKVLPGESRILRHLEDALSRRDNAVGYEAYHLPR